MNRETELMASIKIIAKQSVEKACLKFGYGAALSPTRSKALCSMIESSISEYDGLHSLIKKDKLTKQLVSSLSEKLKPFLRQKHYLTTFYAGYSVTMYIEQDKIMLHPPLTLAISDAIELILKVVKEQQADDSPTPI